MGKEKHCFCLESAAGFMIGCDNCKRWFHGDCVKITKKASQKIDNWYCVWCSQSKKVEEDFIEKLNSDMERFKSQIKTEMLQELHVMRDQILTDKISDQQVSELEKMKRENDLNLTYFKEQLALKEAMISDLERQKEESQIIIEGLQTKLENIKREKDKIELNHTHFQKKVTIKQRMIDNLQSERDKAQEELQKLKSENGMKLVPKEQKKHYNKMSVAKPFVPVLISAS